MSLKQQYCENDYHWCEDRRNWGPSKSKCGQKTLGACELREWNDHGSSCIQAELTRDSSESSQCINNILLAEIVKETGFLQHHEKQTEETIKTANIKEFRIP